MRLAQTFIVLSLACVGALSGYVLACSPKAEQQAIVQADYTVTEGSHGEELRECLAKAKADSGTLAEFCECWTAKNAKYKVDAGTECKR